MYATPTKPHQQQQQQQGYPPQQQGYPPQQQQGYPPQQQGYPQQQQGYAQPQPGYAQSAPQQGYPAQQAQPYPVQQQGYAQPVAVTHAPVMVAVPPVVYPPDYLPPAVLAPHLQPPDTWTSGIFGCFDDVSSCCEIIWCEYCQMGYQHRKVTTGYTGSDNGHCCMICCLDMWLTFGLAFAYSAYSIRDNLRRRWNIEPHDDCTNCLLGFCCSWCSLCQTYRELSARGYWPQGVCVGQAPPVTRPMGGMAAPAMPTAQVVAVA